MCRTTIWLKVKRIQYLLAEGANVRDLETLQLELDGMGVRINGKQIELVKRYEEKGCSDGSKELEEY